MDIRNFRTRQYRPDRFLETRPKNGRLAYPMRLGYCDSTGGRNERDRLHPQQKARRHGAGALRHRETQSRELPGGLRRREVDGGRWRRVLLALRDRRHGRSDRGARLQIGRTEPMITATINVDHRKVTVRVRQVGRVVYLTPLQDAGAADPAFLAQPALLSRVRDAWARGAEGKMLLSIFRRRITTPNEAQR